MDPVKPLAAAFLCSLALSFAPRANAGQAEEARAAFKRGTALYEQNDFQGALAEFKRADDLAPTYRLQFNIGQVEMELNDYAGALKAYTRYLKEGGAEVPGNRRQQVTQDIEVIRGRVGQIAVQGPLGAQVLVDDAEAGYVPLPEPVIANVGRHKVSIRMAGLSPLSRYTDIEGQQTVTVALFYPRSVTAGLTQAEEPPSKVPIYVAWGVTGALAVAAGICAGLAVADANSLASLRSQYPVPTQLHNAANTLSTVSAVADIGGLAAVIAGGIALTLTLTYKQPKAATHSSTRTSLKLSVSPTGAQIAANF